MGKSLWILILLNLAPSLWGAADRPMSWAAYGDFRGHVEPCGCDPLTDLGGIERLGGYLRQVRRLHADAWIFDLGNNLGDPGDALQRSLWIDVWSTIKPDAILWNLREQEQESVLKHSMPRERKKWPSFVCSGLAKIPASGESLCSDMVKIKDQAVVFGYAEGGKGNLPVNVELLDRWRTSLKKQKPTVAKVLLFAGSDAALKQVQDAQLFDVIVSSNTTQQLEPTPIEKDEPGRLLRLNAVYMVPSFGQGVLLGGNLRKGALEEMLGQPANCPKSDLTLPVGKNNDCKKAGTLVGEDKLVNWLDRNQATMGSGIEKPWQRYQKGIRDQYQKWVALKKKEDVMTPFAGAEVCQSCHATEYDVWKSSLHAKALISLEAKHKDRDKSCVTCHVVGFEQAGGFIDSTLTKNLAGVQCENCHGPRKQHVRDPHTFKGQPGEGKKACESCHRIPHSADFQFDAYWPKIKH